MPEAHAGARSVGPVRGTELVRYDAMCRAIADAYEVDEVKSIRDQAIVLETYCRQAKNVEAERQACEIRLRAERKAGKLLKEGEKNKGGGDRRSDHRSNGATGDVPTIAGLGISKGQSSRWQQLADVPDELFDEALTQAGKPSTKGILSATTKPKAEPVAPEALWLWGRLRDFERDLLAHEPAEIMRTLPSEMLDDIHTLAPRVAAWLRRIGGLHGT